MSLKLLSIENELSGPNREVAFTRYDAALAALNERLVAQMNLGLQRDAFARVDQLKEATLVARKLLRLAVKEASPSAASGGFKQ